MNSNELCHICKKDLWHRTSSGVNDGKIGGSLMGMVFYPYNKSGELRY